MKHPMTLITLTLLFTLAVTGVFAQDDKPDCPCPCPESNRQGLFLGIGLGGGDSTVSYKDGSRHIWEEPFSGATGSLRIGYAINPKFAIALEGYGFGTEENDEEWGLGAALATATWHPAGGGFFLKAGVGGGGGEFSHPETGELKKIERRLAGLFGLGYDWDLGEKFSLGLSVEAISMEADEALGYDEGHIGSSSLGVQFNWFL